MKINRKEAALRARQAKRAEREEEDRVRIARRASMLQSKQRQSLVAFISSPAMSPHSGLVSAMQVHVAQWDVARLQADATRLLKMFGVGVQFGDTHRGKWNTLCLRSCDGTPYNDSPAPAPLPAQAVPADGHGAAFGSTTSDAKAESESELETESATQSVYHNTPVWQASEYIVPVMLKQHLGPLFARLQRVRLSIIPPGCFVAWHCDYAPGPMQFCTRMHIPVHCSRAFHMDIGGIRTAAWEAGSTWLGNFELPHRLSNGLDGSERVHLICDFWMDPKQLPSSLPAQLPLPLPLSLTVPIPLWSDTDSIGGGGDAAAEAEADADAEADTVFAVTFPAVLALSAREGERRAEEEEGGELAIPSSASSISRSSYSGLSIEREIFAANQLLTSNPHNCNLRDACIAEFNAYRWGDVATTTAGRAEIEEGYYSTVTVTGRLDLTPIPILAPA